MAAKEVVSKAGRLFLGHCIPCLKHNASKFRVQTMDLDEDLLMFFKNFKEFYAYDPNKICKTGDIVLLEELPTRMSTSITHKVLEVIYPFGDITDPISGKTVMGDQYRDDLEAMATALGKSKTAFSYKKAPKRGWQQGKKDFSHRETYIKYHEFEEGHEYHDQPFSKTYV